MMKQLPAGAWFTFRGLPPDITDEEVRAFLFEHGLTLPVEQISIRVADNGRMAMALICITKPDMQGFLTWAFDGCKLRDQYAMTPLVPGNK